MNTLAKNTNIFTRPKVSGTPLELAFLNKVKLVSKNYWKIAVLMLAVSLASIFFLSSQSLRLDEAQSLWQSSHSPARILNIIGQDVHVPLYPLLLHFWQLLFGNSINLARVMSLSFFLASIPTMFYLGKTAFGKTTAFYATVLFCVSPFLNWYANEVRMYSLFTFLTILNQLFFLKIYHFKISESENAQKKYNNLWLGFFLTALLGIYTHYFFLLVLFNNAVFFFLYRNRFAKLTTRRLFYSLGILALTLVPWIIYVFKLGLLSNTRPVLIKPTTINLFNTFSQFIFGFQNDHLNTLIVSLWPLSVLMAFLSFRKNKKISPESAYFFISGILPIVIVFFISLTLQPLFLTRYLIFVVPSLYLFLAWFVSSFPPRISKAFKVVLVGVILLTFVQEVYSQSTPVKENYKEASDYITQNATPQDIVLVSSPFTIYPVEYYYRGGASLQTLPFWNRFVSGAIPSYDPQKIDQEVSSIRSSHQRVFLVLSYDQGYEKDVKLYFDTRFHRLEEKKFSSALNLYVYKLRYDNISFDEIINKTSNPSPPPTPVSQ